MKKVLAVVIAVAFISIGAVSSDAQVPNVQIYFDANLTQTQGLCQGIGIPQTLYVVYQNFNAAISTTEFGIDWGVNGAALWFGGDVHIPGALFLGTSWQAGALTDGVTITYPIPQNGFGPMVAMWIQAFWNCDTCDLGGGNFQKIEVKPHDGTGNILCVTFATFQTIHGIGMNAHACPGAISTEEATWGKVKALYN
jgi:hypothetical protein